MRILRATPHSSDVRRGFGGEDRVSFNLHGEPCVVWEPFGDNSRYWVGPSDAKDSKLDLTQLHQAFLDYQFPLARLLSRYRRQDVD